MKFLFLISAFISLIVSLLFLLSIFAWLNGIGSVFFPGLGLVVAIWVFVIFLLLMAVVSISLTILVYKSVYKKKNVLICLTLSGSKLSNIAVR
jgi:hypothetical protein